MSSNKTVVAAVAAVIVAAVAIAAVATFIDGGNDDADSQEVDNWYQVAVCGYSGDKLIETGSRYDHDYDIVIYQQESGLFCGNCFSTNITGVLTSDGYMSFYTDDFGESLYFEGQIDGSTMTGTMTGTTYTGLPYALYLAYSSDPLATAETAGLADLTGAWNIQSAVSFSDGAAAPLQGTALEVKGQTGSAFYGTIEEQMNGAVTTLNFAAVLGDTTVGSYRYGIMINDGGEVWSVLTDGQSLLLQTVSADEAISRTAPLAAERTYTRAGDAAAVSFDVPNVAGTTWTETDCHYAKTWNTIAPAFGEHTVTVAAQNGRMFLGTDTFAGVETPFAAYFFNSTEFAVYYGSLTAASDCLYGCGSLSGDVLQLTKVLRNEDETLKTVQMTLTAADPVIPTDLTGQWYAVWTSSGRIGRSSETYSIDGDEAYFVTGYNLTVTEQQGSTFRGVYAGGEVIGTYANGELAFNIADTAGTDVYVAYYLGYMLNEHAFILTEEHYSSSGGLISVWTTLYTDEVKTATMTPAPAALAGTWEIPAEGYAFWYNGENSGLLEGTALTLSTDGWFVTGTIEEGEKGEITSGLIGVRADSENTFWFFDERGYAFYVWWDGADRLALLLTDVFGTADEPTAIERVYVRNGAEPGEAHCMDLDGTTWSAGEGRFSYADGTVTAVDNVTVKFTQLTIDEQTNLISGTMAADGLSEDLALRGYVGSDSGMFCLKTADGIYYGRLILQEDGTMLLTFTGSTNSAFEVTLTKQ